MNGEITRDELSTGLDQEIVFDTDKVKSLVDIEIKGRTLVNLLGRSGNAIYQQIQHFNCSLNATIGFDAECITLTNNETVQAGKILALTAFRGRAEVGKYYLFACEKVAGTIGQVAFYGCSLLSYSWNEDDICYGLYKFNGVESDGSSHIDMVFGGMQPSETASIKNVRLYEISEVEAQSIINHDKGASTPAEIVSLYPYVDDVKCVVNPYLESKENLLDGAVFTPNTVCLYGQIATVDNNLSFTSGRLFECEPNTTYTIYNPNDFPVHALFEKTDTVWASENELIQHEVVGKRTVTTTVQNGVMLYFTVSSEDIANKIAGRNVDITIVKGSESKSYEDCHNSRIMFETKLRDGETIVRRNDGAYVKNNDWEEINFADNFLPPSITKQADVDVLIFNDYRYHTNSATDPVVGGKCGYMSRYDGKIIPSASAEIAYHTYENWHFGGSSPGSSDNRLYLTIPHSLSGWGVGYVPTQDEIKAFFLGWRMFISDTSGELYNGTGTKAWAKLWNGIGTAASWTTCKVVSGSGTNALPTTINDYGYTPYRLIYKRETPIIEEVKTYGELVTKDSADILASSGLVLGERFKPVHNGTQYVFNTNNLSNGARGNNRIDSIVKVLDGDAFVQYFEQIDNGIRNGRSQCKLIDFDGQSVYTDYLIYSPDTVTSFDYSLKEVKTVKEVLNKSQGEIANCFEELAKTKRKLERAEEELSQRSNPNLLINGDFQVWQRGTSFTANNSTQYGADRWLVRSNNTGVVTKASKLDQKIKIETTSYVSPAISGIYHFIDNNETTRLWGKTCTLTVDVESVKGSHNAVVQKKESPYNSYLVISNLKPGKNVITGVIGNDPNMLALYIRAYEVGEIVINSVKLEIGEYATPLVPRNYAEELAMCQRYYEVSESDTLMSAYVGSSGDLLGYYHFKTPKRAKPTVTVNHSGNAGQLWISCNNNYGRKNVTVAYIGDKHVRIQTVEKSLSTHGYAGQLAGQIVADAEIY